MSSSRQETIACPSCGESQSFTVWSSINVSVDLSLKKALLEGRLTTFECQGCGNTGHVAYDLLYHDMDRQLAIWLKYPDEEGTFRIDEPARDLFTLLSDRYVCRLVLSFQELVEKVLVFDDGLDDFAVELLKLVICVREGIDIARPLYYHATHKSLLARRSIAFAFPSEDDVLEKRYPLEKHMASLQPILAKLATVRSDRGSGDPWLHVNREYIMGQLQAAGLMRKMDEEDVERLIVEPGKAASADRTQKRGRSDSSYPEEQRNVAGNLVGHASMVSIGLLDNVVEKACPGARALLERHCVAQEAWISLAWSYFTTIATVGVGHDLALQRCRSPEERAALRDAIRDALCDWERRPWLPTAGGNKRPWDGCPGAHDYLLDYSRFMTSHPAKTRDESALAIGVWIWGNLTNATSDELKSLCPPELVVATGRLILRLSADVVEAAFPPSRSDASDA